MQMATNLPNQQSRPVDSMSEVETPVRLVAKRGNTDWKRVSHSLPPSLDSIVH